MLKIRIEIYYSIPLGEMQHCTDKKNSRQPFLLKIAKIRRIFCVKMTVSLRCSAKRIKQCPETSLRLPCHNVTRTPFYARPTSAKRRSADYVRYNYKARRKNGTKNRTPPASVNVSLKFQRSLQLRQARLSEVCEPLRRSEPASTQNTCRIPR